MSDDPCRDIAVIGYADAWSVRAGEDIRFFVSTPHSQFGAQVVRLLGGMTGTSGEKVPSCAVGAKCDGTYPGRVQHTDIGSYARLPMPADWLSGAGFGLRLRVRPTAPDLFDEQVIVGAYSVDAEPLLELLVKGGALVVRHSGLAGGAAGLSVPIRAVWYEISVDLDRRLGALHVHACEVDAVRAPSRSVSVSVPVSEPAAVPQVASTLVAGAPAGGADSRSVGRHFNGKIEDPVFYGRGLSDAERAGGSTPPQPLDDAVLGLYDLGSEVGTTRLVDRSPAGRDGWVFNSPQRAVTSSRWDGTASDFRLRPDQYAAVHFHEDDLDDASWDSDFAWSVPADLESGAYALRLSVEDDLDYIPFFVRSGSGRRASVAFLAPTFTYQAYANEHLYEAGGNQQFMDHDARLSRHESHVLSHPEVGKSVYDLHVDGTGVAHSSRLRPVLNFRPHQRNWLANHVRHLAADLFILGWLDSLDVDYEVLTDEDLHRDGGAALDGYRVVLTGSHPEYWTRPMMTALNGYLDGGGRLMYLGGNGFYWVTSVFPDRPHLIEVRRGNVGTRSWNSAPGEATHSACGDPGGLWRFNGHPPHALLGVGMASQGWGHAAAYERLPDSFDPRVERFFRGIGPEEVIGDFGYVLGGAAGDEVDRYALELGTPDQTLRLATATGLGDQYQLAQEELLVTAPGQGGADNDKVRSDLTYLELDGGGRVFSVGSICWAGSLAWNDYDNNVARLTGNVLDAFLNDEAPTSAS